MQVIVKYGIYCQLDAPLSLLNTPDYMPDIMKIFAPYPHPTTIITKESKIKKQKQTKQKTKTKRDNDNDNDNE